MTIEVQDQDGVPVKHGEPLISVAVSGAGELIAIGSGNPLSEEPYVGSQHTAYHGRLLAIVRSAAQAGRDHPHRPGRRAAGSQDRTASPLKS